MSTKGEGVETAQWEEVIRSTRKKILKSFRKCLYATRVAEQIEQNGSDLQLDWMNQCAIQIWNIKQKLKRFRNRLEHVQRDYFRQWNDISFGKEKRPITWVNDIDNDCPPLIEYIVSTEWDDIISYEKHVKANNKPNTCECVQGCTPKYCCHADHPLVDKSLLFDTGFYNKNGGLSYILNGYEQTDLCIVECNPRCSCGLKCYNRVVQKGIQYDLQLFKTKRKGWGVRALEPIPKGRFVCEYVGVGYVSNHVDANFSSYIFELQSEGKWWIDAAEKSNISRFFNHSCSPNMSVFKVYIETLNTNLPHLAFFTTKNIKAGEELHFGYGETWPMQEMGQKGCQCGAPNCENRHKYISSDDEDENELF
eukprot:gb/GECH01002500.1/.p1 GENE.gb/GECH01002500.1/~~gb/GECH01002500.1/.p1  ORF type:complete len:365 (+),score=88.71 gb/GECH01002500.1/:1-1095(+)